MATVPFDRFLSRNLTANLLVVLTFPLYEIAALLSLLPDVLPAGQVLAIEAIAWFAVWQADATLGAIRRSALIWIAVGWTIILALALRQAAWQNMLEQFSLVFFIAVFAFLALEKMLLEHAMAWRKMVSAVTSASCLCVGAIIAWVILDQAVQYLPNVYDPVLYRIDAMLWLDGTYRLGDLLQANPGFRHVVLDLYEYILLTAIAALFSEVFHTKKTAAELALQLVISSFMVFPLFCLMPALAPAFFFGPLFPDHLPNVNSVATNVVSTNIETIRNTCPSLHAVWAILIWLALSDSPAWHRMLGAAFLVVTFIATVGFGEHYVVDWVAAAPLVLLVRGICCASLPLSANLRRVAIVLGCLLLASWVLVVRAAPLTLEFPWAIRLLAGLSVASCMFTEKILALAERSAGCIPEPLQAILRSR